MIYETVMTTQVCLSMMRVRHTCCDITYPPEHDAADETVHSRKRQPIMVDITCKNYNNAGVMPRIVRGPLLA